MKKKKLLHLALLGLMGTTTIPGHAANSSSKQQASALSDKRTDIIDKSDGNMGYHLMTEQELMLELDPEGIKLYNSLDGKGKALAREVASQRCNGTNECKGLNACQTDTNPCAGKGSCRATSKCAFSDKNLAVKVVVKKMAGKRESSLRQ
jgi:hypothetical protein